DLVCEGCGDCSIESNCLSVIPKETPFGRKRQIDQNSCNKDFSCINGFCPSFVTVEGGDRVKGNKARDGDFPEEKLASLPLPEAPTLEEPYDLLVTGVGGTGVITVGALITMAAHLEGKGASVLDFMGFAQKFGPVLSYIRIAHDPAELNQVRIDEQQADALIGCDLVVSSSPKASSTMRKGHTRVVLNTTEMSTADFVKFRDANLKASDRVEAIQNVVGKQNLSTIAANQLTESLLGNTIYSNVLMVGYAWQKGLLPISLGAMLRAIELNGVEVEQNKKAFGWGRIAATSPEFVQEQIADPQQTVTGIESLDEIIRRRADFLVDYQDQALSRRFTDLVERVRQTETAVGGGDKLPLTEASARSYFKTLAYKDEYEVARLHTATGFLEKVRRDYGDKARLRFHLAPPLLSRGVDARGRPRKREFGAWMIPAFRLLARLRKLRGTRFDLFGMTAERRMERALIGEFEKNVEILLQHLSLHNINLAIEIVNEYLEIRGYGPVKEEAAEKARARIASKLTGYMQVTSQAA
ncbi:MAG: 2-oxoacid:acceptor oxidoreductase family protein, partial [Proteobacteria bacterium]|nr:2-oxoacid:acceptor oxidoreductase family protein [Pseudomonadota bacterium]